MVNKKNKYFLEIVFLFIFVGVSWAGGSPEVRTLPSNIPYGKIKNIDYKIFFSSESNSSYHDYEILFHQSGDFDSTLSSVKNLKYVKEEIWKDNELITKKNVKVSSDYLDNGIKTPINSDLFNRDQNENGTIITYCIKPGADQFPNYASTYYLFNNKIEKMIFVSYVGTIRHGVKLEQMEEHKYIFSETENAEYVKIIQGQQLNNFIYKFDNYGNLIEKSTSYENLNSGNKHFYIYLIEYTYDDRGNWITANVYHSAENGDKTKEYFIERVFKYRK